MKKVEVENSVKSVLGELTEVTQQVGLCLMSNGLIFSPRF